MKPRSIDSIQHTEQKKPAGMPDVSSFTPADFRLTIAEQVRLDNMALAVALGEAGLSLYPESEDVLAIVALLAEVRRDWASAIDHLSTLVAVQKELSPPTTWHHWIRSLRCNCEPREALQVAEKALRLYPEDKTLITEYQDLKLWSGGSCLMEGTSNHQH